MSFSTHIIIIFRREQYRITLLELVFVRRIVLVSREATSFFDSLNDEEPISIFCMFCMSVFTVFMKKARHTFMLIRLGYVW